VPRCRVRIKSDLRVQGDDVAPTSDDEWVDFTKVEATVTNWLIVAFGSGLPSPTLKANASLRA
jgi:hypothetical protein